MGESQLVVQNIQGVVVVNFADSSILDGSDIESIGKRLYELVDQQAQRKILLDFTPVKHLSSSMLGVLIRLQKRAGAIKGRVIICGLRPDLKQVFKITRLDKLFEFHDDEQQAMASFGITNLP